jgi:hypothetical protein
MPPNSQHSLFQDTELRNASKDSALLRYNLSKVTKNSTTFQKNHLSTTMGGGGDVTAQILNFQFLNRTLKVSTVD